MECLAKSNIIVPSVNEAMVKASSAGDSGMVFFSKRREPVTITIETMQYPLRNYNMG